ncbi:hypothetical protein [Achromobacter xylosoxidans]|uniref:hypothetical protein n=1 Tax=Alcaligenes xylosoxydans xylosoxydans TaxID=85698 RepID=UPI00292DC5FC|nr:hypothetical protein [Achromobacter xylosoxidans]WOB75887.1 hypothetical protein PZA07_10610 [Achromobacter xylosoxidans]
MTQQDDITQRVLTDDEIQALWDEACKDSPQAPGWNRHIRYGRAIESALLTKLRAPVSSIREGFELTYAADADDPACASDLSHFTNGWRACVMSQVRAPVADERAALQKLVDLEDMRLRLKALHEMGHGTDYDYYHKALPAAWEAARAALASAPVAGEVQQPVAHWIPSAKTFSTARVSPGKAWEPLYAAPQASAEDVRNAALEALEAAQRFIRNGIELGYIRMPDADTPDPAQRTPDLIDAAIRALKQPQADKDGGQQRAGNDCKHARAYRAGDRQGYACPDCGEFVSDYEIHRRQRAALSATQAEQGERDA